MARREKKPVHKSTDDRRKPQHYSQVLEEYEIENAEDIQKALKDLLGGTIKEMMEVWIFRFYRIVNRPLNHRL